MSRAGKSGLQPCTRTQARQRLDYGRKCFDVADLIGEDPDDDWAPKVAVSLHVLAGIAAADAITGALQGERWRGADHRGAIALLGEVTGSRDAGKALSDLLDLKDKAQYSPHLVSAAEEKQATRRAAHLIERAAEALRG
jgi:hypothetical protein